MVALCARAAVMIDTPLRDVLPHSAYTFLFCQEGGVLILSEFSGSAQSLRAAALCVNPWDTNAFADAIQEALEMDPEDRNELHRYGRKHVTEYTLNHWAVNYLEELLTAKSEVESERLQIPPQLDHDKPVSCMRKAGRRMLILGFSGTLMPHLTRIHSKIFPKLNEVLLSNLQVIAEDPNTYVIVVSSLPRDALANMLAGVPCWIIAEGGVCYREPGSEDWHSSVEQRDTEWLGPVKEIMEYFAARTPGSNVVEMTSSVSWLYQKTQGDHAAIQSKDLLIHLWAGPLLSAPAEVVIEKDCVNVKPTGVGKALQLERLLQQICCGDDGEKASKRWFSGNALVLCVGDFLMRDEDLFVTVQKFFEPEGTDRHKPASTPDTDRWDQGMGDREARMEELNLELNSMSLGKGYDKLSQLERDEEGNMSLHKSMLEVFFSEVPKKIPSESDLPVAAVEPEHGGDATAAPINEDDFTGLPQVFTCTVSRKPTRAAHHLSDTNDVAFLIAKLARELRQAKQLAE
uniref:Alpha,alpha-trehalose-phosphate synthase (UDP-forming) n=1 Tax=Alexandrium catenella TaxID=2925 RepID=A0A7S1WSD0_ALECA